jgi:4'-phosphopantetheinyl transferase
MITLHHRPANPAEVQLGDDEVHLWRQRFSQVEEATLLHGIEHLSAEERKRVERISDPGRRARVALSRIFVREVLAGYLKTDLSGVKLITGPLGRPDLDTKSHPVGISFNLSHSGDFLTLGIARAPSLGRDGLKRILRRCFTEIEIQAVRAAGHGGLDAFYRGWTRKEALLKAQGGGVFSGARSTEVSLADVYLPPILTLHGDREQARQWSLLSLQPREDMVGAVAVPNGQWRLRLFERHS